VGIYELLGRINTREFIAIGRNVERFERG